MIEIRKWNGRLGNNITQLKNALLIGICKNITIKLKKQHDFFDVRGIEKDLGGRRIQRKILNKHDFFKTSSLVKDFPEVWEKLPFHYELITNILKRNFKIKNTIKLPEDTIVIHVRSGDLFSRKTPYTRYIPPPLSYYTKHLEQIKYKKIIIVCEDRLNPVVNKLLNTYNNIYYQKNTLEEDIEIILGASSIIQSVGTFIPSLSILSDNLKKLYTSSFFAGASPKCFKKYGKATTFDVIDLDKCFKEYLKVNSPWKMTAKQVGNIIKY